MKIQINLAVPKIIAPGRPFGPFCHPAPHSATPILQRSDSPKKSCWEQLSAKRGPFRVFDDFEPFQSNVEH
jgi:hypothetical protein